MAGSVIVDIAVSNSIFIYLYVSSTAEKSYCHQSLSMYIHMKMLFGYRQFVCCMCPLTCGLAAWKGTSPPRELFS